MEELDIDVSEVARRLDSPQSNVSMYLTGKRNPKWDKIVKWAKVALECDPYWLSGRTKPGAESVRVREASIYDSAAKILAAGLPPGERTDSVLLLLTCDEETLQGVLGGLSPFLDRARKAKNLSSG